MKPGIPTSAPPIVPDHHLKPEQIADVLHATAAHHMGYTGKGVRIAVIDSGFYRHPYYERHGYKISPLPTEREPEPENDEYGHGTAQLASLFAVAPDAEVLAIKCMDKDPSSAIERAIEAKPHVLTCAWGFNIDRPGTRRLPEEYQGTRDLLLRARDKGIAVIAAAGNGQYSFPGCMPELICAGGVFYTEQGRFEISDLSSQYASSIYPGRSVPDVCGLVGNRPHGRLLLVPVPPQARLAKRPAFSAHGTAEGLKLAPGWAMFSGTSASTAMTAGAAALCLQARPGLTPDELKCVLIAGSFLVEEPCRVLSVIHSVKLALETAPR